MNVTRTDISASRIELTVSVSLEEMAQFGKRAAENLSAQKSIEGFRPGKAPYDVVRARFGDMAILEEASRLAVSKTIDQAIKEKISDGEEWIGHPEITLTKLAPDNVFEYRALITLLPPVELGEYKNLGVTGEKVEATDADVEKLIEQLRDVRVREAAVTRPAENGDKVIADVNLFLDKVPVEGGQAKETAVILGKDYFVPGFDEHLIGAQAGDERNFFVTYPSDHHQKNLAGKKVEFTAKVKQVYSRELPEVNDEFAAAFGLENADKLKESIRMSIMTEKKQAAEQKLENELIEKVTTKATVGEIPESLIDQELHTMYHELEHNVGHQGMKMEDYLTGIGKTSGQLKEEMRPNAIERMKATLVLRKIISVEGLNVDQKDIDMELEKQKAYYAKEPKTLEALGTPGYRRQLESRMLNRRVVDKLKDWNLTESV